jgi:hypothetical protein
MSPRSLLCPLSWEIGQGLQRVQPTDEPQGAPILPGGILTPGSVVSIPMRSAGWVI